MKYGTFNLDSLLYIGMSCLTPEFLDIPPGYDKPVDVFSDELNYPPLTNIDYFNSGPLYFKKLVNQMVYIVLQIQIILPFQLIINIKN